MIAVGPEHSGQPGAVERTAMMQEEVCEQPLLLSRAGARKRQATLFHLEGAEQSKTQPNLRRRGGFRGGQRSIAGSHHSLVCVLATYFLLVWLRVWLRRPAIVEAN